MNLRVLLLLLTLGMSNFLGGQELLPPIYNYPIFEYNAAGQNWGLSVDKDGELFVANNKGLLHFNGEQWNLYRLPNKTVVRSVVIIGDKIYTGSYEEFGYWEKNGKGSLEYSSLTHLISGHKFNSEEFWQIVPSGNGIYFRSFSRIYKYQDDSIQVINPYTVVTNLIDFNGDIIVVDNDSGIYRLSQNQLLPIIDNSQLGNAQIVDLIPFNDGLLLGTKQKGCFLLKDDELSPWGPSLTSILNQHQLNKMIQLSDGKLAFGTIKRGVYIYDSDTEKVENIKRETGLQNNTVLSMIAHKGQLWLGLDNGIDRVQLDAPITYFTDHTGVLGTVYDMAFYRGTLFLGSNTGVYYFKDDELKFVKGSQGHVWDLQVIGDELFCGHNSGTFKVDKDKFESVFGLSGGYTMVKIPEKGNSYLQGTYNGIVHYEKDDSGRWSSLRVVGLNFPIKQLNFENPNTLWVAHPYKGLYRVKIDKDYSFIKEDDIQVFDQGEIPNNFNVKLYNIKNQIVIRSDGQWFKYEPIVGKITRFDEFGPFANKDLVSYDENHFWFIDNEGNKEIIFTDLNKDNLMIAGNQLVRRLVPDSENVMKQNDSIYYFTLGDGFGKLNLKKLKSNLENDKIPSPKLSFFKDQDTLHTLTGKPISIGFVPARELTIQVASPLIAQPRYYYVLNGAEEQAKYTDNGTLRFQNLPFGKYSLEVYTVNIDNEKSLPLEISFEIAPPWYWSDICIVAYVLVIVLFLFSIRKYNRKKLAREQGKLLERINKEQEERLQELEKEKLAKEVRQKQKELAGSILNVTKKNELILELKSILLLNKDKFGNQKKYRSFIKKLDDSINNDEDWKRFEINFKELHEDFFERLLESFPELTPKDLKLCAYLKMNHSSKEIAPLMGISTRGVEIHRYRLRKKLGLDADQNISNFLITFK
ncbi:helix-turn-helix and ligand-binding sensor domain-containing protein [Sediminicola sp. 1XM1-17]|uniref:helix-turn-helix and ligand-binding sensor domain-containing protein n=1 Tax=Sediminicola sp. 1XM1-17 TaxID=3127702 RepID=UPI003076F6B6